MNDGVALLLERMKTHPEEFLAGGLHIASKWGGLIAESLDCLNDEDALALKAGLNQIKQQRFTERVMEELVDPKKSSLEDVINQYRVKGMSSVGTTLTLSSMASSIGGMLPNDPAAPNYFLKKEEKTHKTLFGRLFNYQ
jgi:hypothetical protein